ncbi:MAG: hypothetical protein IPL46_33235 [Saprospiraceae bacterium]|nr:hypothetical protein [Saprospiraceae bacterium]
MSERIFRLWTLTALASFVIAACLGVMLRYAFVGELPEWLQFRHLQHTHSHVAMMGWLYSGLYILIVRFFDLKRSIYARLFWLTQIVVIGMFFSFPVQGYGLFSISFTTLHLVLSYVFMIQVFRDLKPKSYVNRNSVLFLKSALILLFVSTLGTWALGAIMNSSLKGTAWYYGAIQFFLHYQFNGWFIFGVLGLFFKYLEDSSIHVKQSLFSWFYWLLLVSCILTFALSVTWSTPDKMLFWINSIGVTIQLGALLFFWRLLHFISHNLRSVVRSWTLSLWLIAFLFLSLKIIVQALVAIPALAIVSYTIRIFVVGFIHLLMLGVISLFIFGAFHQLREKTEKLEKVGIYLFLTGFLTTELLLFIQGLMLWIEWGYMPSYHLMILLVSLFFPLGLLCYIWSVYRARPGMILGDSA